MKQLRPALVLTAFFVVVTGLCFPGLVFVIGQLVFPRQAGGSFVTDGRGAVVGSALIGQNFSRPAYFHPRPSAAGAGYDGANSSGSNLGPSSKKLVESLGALATAYREENGLAADAVIPADAATRSASGLDPEISPANAELQIARVARARNVGKERVRKLVAAHTRGRVLGVVGEPRVNVLELNLALDGLN